MIKIIISITLTLITSEMYGQTDTVVMTNNRILTGEVLPNNKHSILLVESRENNSDTVQIGKHLIAYIQFRDGSKAEYKMIKWSRKAISEPLLNNRNQLGIGGGLGKIIQPAWGSENPNGYLREYTKGRLCVNFSSSWYINKSRNRASYFIAMDWADLTLSLGDFTLWGGGFDDWFSTLTICQPGFGMTHLFGKNHALDLRLIGGFSQYWESGKAGFSSQFDVGIRNQRGFLGIFVNYGESRKYGPGSDAMKIGNIGVSGGFVFN